MAGTAYGSFAVGDANIDNVMLQTAAVEVGHCALTLTEMTTTTIPQIAAGSRIEVNGTIFHFDSNDTITGSATTGTNYIYITAAGVATWTATAPTWFDSKQGWYTAAGTSRYIPYYISYSSPSYLKYETINKSSTLIPVSSSAGVMVSPIGMETSILNVTTGIKKSGSFVAGFLSDGTPFYRKYISFTWPLSGSVTIAHGISNAFTSQRIISAFSGFYGISTGKSAHYANVAGYMYEWDNTNITITSSLAVNGTAHIYIDYK